MDLHVIDLLVAFVAGLGAGLLIVTLLDELEREEATP